jgi:hypothetical protein
MVRRQAPTKALVAFETDFMLLDSQDLTQRLQGRNSGLVGLHDCILGPDGSRIGLSGVSCPEKITVVR